VAKDAPVELVARAADHAEDVEAVVEEALAHCSPQRAGSAGDEDTARSWRGHVRRAFLNSRAKVYAALILYTLLASGTYLVGKRSLQEIPALALCLFRFVGASVLLALIVRRMPPRELWPKIALLGLVGVPINQGFFLYGLQRSTAAHAALLYTLTPLFVLLLAQVLLQEIPGWRTVVGTLLALGGTIFVLLERGVDRGPLFGDLLILVAVIAWAIFSTEGRELTQKHGPVAMLAWSLIAGAILYLPVGLGSLWFEREALRHVSVQAWLGLPYLIVITSVVSYSIWYWALSKLPAARVAVFSNLQPLCTAMLAHFLLGEHNSIAFYVAAIVVIAGVVLAQQRRASPA
jgi:drug/metabolite transporter (DMT)-like permease